MEITDKKLLIQLTTLYAKKCPFCKKKFEKELYNKKWNYETLAHIKETHGYDPEMFFEMLREVYGRTYL